MTSEQKCICPVANDAGTENDSLVSAPPPSASDLDNYVLNEVQLLLSQKRTALSTMRTGIAIFAFPLSVLSVLVATSKSYQTTEVLHWLVPLVLLNIGLVGLGVYLITIAVRRIRRYDRLREELKLKHGRLRELLAED